MPTKTLVDTDSTQTLTNKTLTAPTLTSAVVALAAAPTATLDAATKGYVDGLNTNPLNNGSIAATVSANSLTVHLKTAGGSVPSSSDPVRITFRNSTDADGSVVTRTVTSATTMTVASGSTLGMANSTAARLWVGLIDSSGTVEVCIWNPLVSSTLSLKGFTPNTDVTTTAEGSGTATSAHVLYSTNARSSVPFVLLGFIEISEATAGVWATAPTVVQVFRDGYRKTGDRVQFHRNMSGDLITGLGTIPDDDTIPQITEGDQYLTQAITPTSAINLIMIEAQAFNDHSAGGTMCLALFVDATANALAATRRPTATEADGDRATVLVRAGSVSSQTYRMRLGSSSAGTTTLNGTGGARRYGGVMASFLSVEEIYV